MSATPAGADTYLSPCGWFGNTANGTTAVNLRPDASYTTAGGDATGARDWMIEGGTVGTSIKYGDAVKLKSAVVDLVKAGMTANNYLSPSGAAATASCGVAATLRLDSNFTPNFIATDPSTFLRSWKVSGKDVGIAVQKGDIVQLKCLASKWPNHDGYLYPCGTSWGSCGVGVALLVAADAALRNWKLEFVRK
jgi:hypothetical protein